MRTDAPLSVVFREQKAAFASFRTDEGMGEKHLSISHLFASMKIWHACEQPHFIGDFPLNFLRQMEMCLAPNAAVERNQTPSEYFAVPSGDPATVGRAV